jgi:hypothetical protein
MFPLADGSRYPTSLAVSYVYRHILSASHNAMPTPEPR